MTGKRTHTALVAVCGLAAATAGVALAAYSLPALQALWLQGYFLCR
jgi:hypothetical protein